MLNIARNNTIFAILSALLALLLVTAISCAPPTTQPQDTEPSTPDQQAVRVTDDIGRTVIMEKVPEKIVSLAPSNTEMLFALGLGEKVVGVTDFCNYPPETEQKAKVGGFDTPDIEKIVALDPDLILATSIHEREAIPALEDKGLTVLGVNPQNLNEILDSIEMVGKVTGKQEQASALVNDMKERINAVTSKTADLEEKPRVLYVTWHDPLWSVGSGTLIHELITKAGGNNIFQDITGHKTVDIETVIERNPEVIIACTGHGGAKDKPLEWARTVELLEETAARQNNRIYQVNADLVSRASPRIAEGLEWMAYFIHPEIFSKP